jgi:hypothetical protein
MVFSSHVPDEHWKAKMFDEDRLSAEFAARMKWHSTLVRAVILDAEQPAGVERHRRMIGTQELSTNDRSTSKQPKQTWLRTARQSHAC